MKYLLDTHAWIWWHVHPARLSAKVKSCIGQLHAPDELLLSAISPWEFAKLLEKGRLRLSISGEVWIRDALQMPTLRVVPLSPEIAWHSTTLPGSFHDDPADQIIVATARAEHATLLTNDRLIRSYPHVQTVW